MTNTRFTAVLMRELRRLQRRPRYLIIVTLGIVFSYVFFITLMRSGQPQKLPVAVVDHDASYLSRRLCQELNATQGVSVVAVYNNHMQARKALQQQEIYAFIEIPEGTYANLLDFKTPHLALYTSNSYLLPGQLSYRSLATICRLASGAVHREILRKQGFDEHAVTHAIQPIALDAHYISNPTANYQPYVLTTVLPGIIGLMAVLFTLYIIGEEQHLGTARHWMETAGGNIVTALAAKLLPYFLYFSLLTVCGNLILFGPLHYTLQGSFVGLALLSMLYIVALQAVAVFIAALVPTMHLSICIGAIYTTLAFTMSGFSFPVTSMPPAMQGFSVIFPLRHYYLTYVDIALFDAPFMQCVLHALPLLALCSTFFIATLILYRNHAKSFKL